MWKLGGFSKTVLCKCLGTFPSQPPRVFDSIFDTKFDISPIGFASHPKHCIHEEAVQKKLLSVKVLPNFSSVHRIMLLFCAQ